MAVTVKITEVSEEYTASIFIEKYPEHGRWWYGIETGTAKLRVLSEPTGLRRMPFSRASVSFSFSLR